MNDDTCEEEYEKTKAKFIEDAKSMFPDFDLGKEYPVASPVRAIPCYGIYADYDSNTPDSMFFLYVSNEELAQKVCKFLSELDRSLDKSIGLYAFTEGWEWCKCFNYRATVVPDGHIYQSFLEFIENEEEELSRVDEDSWEDEDENEEENEEEE